jgi:hypothetical protein
MHEFEEANFKTSFHKFIERFVDKRFDNPWQLAMNRIHETQKMILCNFRQVSLVATRIKEYSVKRSNEPSDDKASPETTRGVQ